MKDYKIAIVGKTKATECLSLFLKQKVQHDLIKINSDDINIRTLEKENCDLILLVCSARYVAPCCQILHLLKKVISPNKILVLSETKDAELMFSVLNYGISKFIVGNICDGQLYPKLIKEMNFCLNNPTSKCVLAIGAHPDDVEIGCGGTLKKHSEQGDEVIILTLTKGAKGGNKTERETESKNAAKSLNAKLVMYDLEDTQLSNGGSTIQSIEQTIKSYKPSLIYTHSINDTHQDHRATHYATLVAARQIEKIYAYLAPSGTLDFHPRYFEHVEDFIDDKMSAINCFVSQTVRCQRPYLKRSIIESTAEYWGRFSNYGQVEPFEVIRA